MSDGTALLRAIIDDPDDDAPRLIYADWLDENGDPARAAFIRAQIKLARLPQDDPDRDRLVQTERTLWKANRDAWKAWVPEWARVDRFHRGFVEDIRCDAEDFIAHADEVRSRTPLRGARLDGNEAIAVAVFRSRALDGLRRLTLSFPMREAGWSQFAECPYLERLSELDLTSNGGGNWMIQALVNTDALPALQTLKLKWCGLGDAHVIALANAPRLARLRALDLGHNHIYRDGAKALIESPHLDLQYLNLAGNKTLTADRLTVEALRKRFGERVKL
jgi:uncharacterized protein (TIGR02996 family)